MFLDVIVSIAACSVFMVNTFGEETEVNTEIMQRGEKKNAGRRVFRSCLLVLPPWTDVCRS